MPLDRTHPKVTEAVEAATSHCFSWFKRLNDVRTLLVLAGVSGCGKTMIASYCANWCASAAFNAYHRGHWPNAIPSVKFVRWPEIADEINSKNFSCLPDLKAAKYLVIDDIGAEKDPFKDATDKLCQILTARERMWTLVTTNVVQEEWAARFDIRVSDRLLRRSTVVDMRDVPSYAEVV